RKYAEANITTNFYVVNEPWLYSLAWCSGAHSVTTNAVHLLKDLSQPLFLMVSGSLLCLWRGKQVWDVHDYRWRLWASSYMD
ncbi:GDPD4 protein, partial [Pachycephala philippinensis]|nr:GDPD4 protein [Pachycephala philippinensis]